MTGPTGFGSVKVIYYTRTNFNNKQFSLKFRSGVKYYEIYVCKVISQYFDGYKRW